MPLSYLEDVTLRLAHGVAGLPEEVRGPHAEYLRSQQNADGGFSGREGPSDLYYSGFALRGLALTGELHGEVAERAARFLQSRLAGQAPIVDFLSLVYGAMLLESSAGIDVFAQAPPGWRDSVAVALERFRRPDGGYAKTDEGQSSSTYHTFLVVICNQLIGRPPVEPDRLAAFVKSRQRPDGGFVEIGPMRNSGTNPTAAAVGVLKVLDRFDEHLRHAVVEFLAELQNDEGGLLANGRIPMADVLSTFTGSLTLSDLQALGEIDVVAAYEYVLSMQAPGGGFRGGVWDEATDVEYTFYGLGALALLHRPAS